MEPLTSDGVASRSWWLAPVACLLIGPWPGWSPPIPAVAAVVLGLVVLARPKGAAWLAWIVVGLALVLPRPGAAPDAESLRQSLDRHLEEMLDSARSVADDPGLQQVFLASGQALQLDLPFAVLRRQVERTSRRVVYLADDRGQLVAWAGPDRAFPYGVRPLGERTWGVAWSASSAVLYLREPVLLEGRLVGAVTVADHALLADRNLWSMKAPHGWILRLGDSVSPEVRIRTVTAPNLEVPVGWFGDARPWPWRWLPLLLLAVMALWFSPWAAFFTTVLGGCGFLLVGEPARAGIAVVVLGVAAASARAGRRLPPWAARALVCCEIAAAAAATLLILPETSGSWLPEHLLRPGWGGVWMFALGLVAAAWPTGSNRISLGRRLTWAVVLAMVGWSVEALRLPVDLWRAPEDRGGVVLPRGELDMQELLPVAPDGCRVDDLASNLAHIWRLDEWRTPSAVTVVDSDGFIVSQWGDLSPAGENTRTIRVWRVSGPPGGQIELRVATGAWAYLSDWQTGETLEATWRRRVFYVAMTRAGRVEATLHSQARGLDAETAGALFHSGRGWALMRVRDTLSLSRIWRDGDWLVAAVAVSPTIPAWAVRVAMAALWALAGIAVVRWPSFGRGQLGTFGGRLRLLVAGAVVLPLVVLTGLLHSRLQHEDERMDQVAGLNALRAARYTADHLAGGFEVDDDLARWLSGVGGEVVLFDGAEPVAVSRPDLLAQGLLPELPPPQAFTSFRLGRDDPVVQRRGGRLAGAGVVEVEGRSLLLELFPTGEGRAIEAPQAVDWLLSGAALAALGALVLTSRVERRLSASLRELVDLARKLHRGEPVGEVPQPRERDLAEVLDAVRSMHQEVQQREIRLRHQEELLRLTLATLSPAVLVLDPTGAVRFANPAADTLIGEWNGAVPGPVLEVVRRRPDGQAPVVETLRPRPGHDETWRVGVVSVPLPDGEAGLVAVVDDITDLVRVDRLRQLNQLARIVAHEVKNPLTPIRLWVQEIVEARRGSDPRLEELLDEACSEISTQVHRLQTTASSFSNLVALERWEPSPLDVHELVRSAAAGLAVLERRGIRLIFDLPAVEEAHVIGDPQWLRRALRNLIQNSLDALSGRSGEVRLTARVDDSFVVIEVEDSAGGIPEEQLQDIFGPHFSTSSSGSGLGLALVLQVVTRCDGRVGAANGARGLCVTIRLPRADGR